MSETVRCGDVLIHEGTGEVHRCLRPFGHKGFHIDSEDKDITGAWTWSPETSERQRAQIVALKSGPVAIVEVLDRIASSLERIAGNPTTAQAVVPKDGSGASPASGGAEER